MNLKFPKIKFLEIMIITTCFLFASSDVFAQIPSGPVTINVENVTVNTPAQESSGNPLADTFVAEVVIMLVGVMGGGAAIIWKVVEKKKTDAMNLEQTRLLNNMNLEQKRKLDNLDIEKQKNMPTTLQQDKIFNEEAQKAYYQSYLPIWAKIWKTIHSMPNTNEQNKFINYIWTNYFGRKIIPREDSLDEIIEAENLDTFPAPPAKIQDDAIEEMLSFLQEKIQRFNLNSLKSDDGFSQEDTEFIKKKLRNLFNDSDVQYYRYIEKETPKLVERAVSSTNLNRDPGKAETLKQWKRDALQELKLLMIFAFLREDTKVLEIMIDAEINKLISKDGTVLPKSE